MIDSQKQQPGQSRRLGAGWRAIALLVFASIARLNALATVEITEFCASNDIGYADQDGDHSDWIELHNAGADSVDLNGWSLTDDSGNPGKWKFPAGVTMEPNGYLIVFASGKSRAISGRQLHANFTLSAGGGYLALLQPGPLVASSFQYPRQRTDVSYGIAPGGATNFFTAPTPGQANTAGIPGFVEDLHFSHLRGFYDAPFELTISTVTPGATIRYTTNGSPPGPTNGAVVSGPVPVSRTSVIRAIGMKEGFGNSPLEAQTFVFPADVIRQSGTLRIPVWGTAKADYDMDTKVVDNPEYSGRIIQDLMSIPVMSISMQEEDLFGPLGIYSNPGQRGASWEKPASMEIFYPDGRPGAHVTALFHIRGDASRNSSLYPKLSFGLEFKRAYGPPKLEHPLFDHSNVERFDAIPLRANFNDGYMGFDTRAQYIRDAFVRYSHMAMGGVSSKSTFVHLYLNGWYWGLYNPCEKANADFAAQAFGGSKDSYDVIDTGGVLSGDNSAWLSVMSKANAGLASPAAYQDIQKLVDIDDFIDYYIVNCYAANWDWPHNNWNTARRKSPDGRFRFFCWDSEGSMRDVNVDRTAQNDDNTPGRLFTQLRGNTEFKVRFGDRVQKHFFNGGALTTNAAIARWMQLSNLIDSAIVGESARWGDSEKNPQNVANTRNVEWLNEENFVVKQFLAQRSARMVSQFKGIGLYPGIAAPNLSNPGGSVMGGYRLFMTNPVPAATLYYTLDGTDPRVPVTGEIASKALRQTTGVPLVINKDTVLKARIYNSGSWSALVEASYQCRSFGLPVRISEIMYAPNGERPFQYIELRNIGGVPVNLGGMSLGKLGFIFPQYTMLPAGSNVVIASSLDPGGFTNRYRSLAVGGWFDGNLSSKGDTVELRDRFGESVTAVHYESSEPWPDVGLSGCSIELVDPLGNPDDPFNWKSGPVNGSPGAAPRLPTPTVRLSEVQPGGTNEWVELVNGSTASVNIGGWSLSDGRKEHRYTFPSNTVVGPGDFLVVSNLSFGLNRNGDSLLLENVSILAGSRHADALTYGNLIPGFTIARFGESWKLAAPTPGESNRLAPVTKGSSICINEWMVRSGPDESDWVEFFNRDATLPAELQGTFLQAGGRTVPIQTLSFIPPRGFFVLKASDLHGFSFKLPATSGNLVFLDTNAVVVDKADSFNPRAGVSRGRLPDGATNSIADFPNTASPGLPNYVLATNGVVVINEVMARNSGSVIDSRGSAPDWLELYNPTGQAADLAGMRLNIGREENGWIFPGGAQIPAKGYLMVWCDTSRPASSALEPELNCGEALTGTGTSVSLVNSSGQIISRLEFGFQLSDRSVGRTAAGLWELQLRPTPGAPNAGPAALGSITQLKLNEWMAGSTNGPDWLELYNPQSEPVLMSGIYLSDDSRPCGKTNALVAPLSFIDAGSCALWVADGSREAGHLPFSLSSQGEALRIYSPQLDVIDGIDYGPQTPGVSRGRLPDGGPTLVDFPDSASPGESNYRLLSSLVASEVLANAAAPFEQAVEFENPGASAVNIAGWFLSDTTANPKKFKIPGGVTVPAHGRRVFYEKDFNASGSSTAFKLAGLRGGSLFLSSANAAGDLTGDRLKIDYDPSDLNVSEGRATTSVGIDFAALDHPTFGVDSPKTAAEFETGAGAANAVGRAGPVVLDELMYAPSSGKEEDQFLELHNAGSAAIPLFLAGHPEKTWRLRSGVEFDFPPNLSIAPDGRIVVVGFDPSDASAMDHFRNKYKLARSAVVVGPWRGKLSKKGESISLLKPGTPEAGTPPAGGLISYVLVERVDYGAAAPWPADASGKGSSLQRKSPLGYANDPANWVAAAPTPGPAAEKDSDGDGIPDAWELDHDLNPADPADAAKDADGDGLSNLGEYLAGTNPRDSSSVLKFSGISVIDGVAHLRFQASPNISYRLESRGSLGNENWDLVSRLVYSTPGSVEATDPVDSTTPRFYRLIVE